MSTTFLDCDDAKSFKEARKSLDLTIIEGARHAFRGKKQNKALLNAVSKWLGERAPKRDLMKLPVLPADSSCNFNSHNHEDKITTAIHSSPLYVLPDHLVSEVRTVTGVHESSTVLVEIHGSKVKFSRPNPKIQVNSVLRDY